MTDLFLPNGGPSRRRFLQQASGGAGAVALNWLLARDAAGAAAKPAANPLAAKKPHFEATAKRVIFLFMVGGPSALDLFTPKPTLTKMHGKPLPESFGMPVSQFTKGDTPLLASSRKFKKHGKSGLPVSDLMPELAKCVDDICFLNSCWCTSTVHAPAMYHLHSGRTTMGYPSLGSWVTYGLGSASDNLPAYCVLMQPEGTPEGGAPCWGAGFLPPVYQGTLLRKGPNPILNLKPPAGAGGQRQKRTMDLLRQMNADDTPKGDTDLEARIASYELAFKMQKHAPEAVDFTKETSGTLALYGIDNERTRDFGQKCLLARRLVERGVRFIQIYSGGAHNDDNWDAHSDMVKNHTKHAGDTDKPIAGLIKDLKRRGLLDSTLIIWGGEFGRQPTAEYAQGTGRDHNAYGFTMWVAGGGIKGGTSVGETDELGSAAVTDRFHVKNLHATVLHQMGLDPNKLTYFYGGLDQKLVGVEGADVIKQII
jgi:hypothetical protein